MDCEANKMVHAIAFRGRVKPSVTTTLDLD